MPEKIITRICENCEKEYRIKEGEDDVCPHCGIDWDQINRLEKALAIITKRQEKKTKDEPPAKRKGFF